VARTMPRFHCSARNGSSAARAALGHTTTAQSSAPNHLAR
jgi:hypothetical protein